jgi:hypothetical protein
VPGHRSFIVFLSAVSRQKEPPMNDKHSIHIFINRAKYEVAKSAQTGHSLKELAGIALGDVLFRQRPGDDEVITNDAHVTITDGDHFHSSPPANYGAEDRHSIHFFINRTKYQVAKAAQTGRSLKELGGVALGDVLFRERPGDDEVIANEAHVTVKDGDHFHSSPPADYGSVAAVAEDWAIGSGPRQLHQPDGWTFVVFDAFPVPAEYVPGLVRLLVKLPPGFPDAAPDMFWIQPAIRLAGGDIPVGTTIESVLGEPWQRFSWHLQPGAWRPGISDLRDFLRCVRTRFERRN